jgi:hypothetical protein
MGRTLYMAISRHQKHEIQWEWEPTKPMKTRRTLSVFALRNGCNECSYMNDDNDMRLK